MQSSDRTLGYIRITVERGKDFDSVYSNTLQSELILCKGALSIATDLSTLAVLSRRSELLEHSERALCMIAFGILRAVADTITGLTFVFLFTQTVPQGSTSQASGYGVLVLNSHYTRE